jgi:hypothetical protein
MLGYGSADAWCAAVYGQNSANALNFLQEQYQRIGGYATEAARNFYESSKKAFNHFNGTQAMQYARKVLGELNMASEAKYIIEMTTLKDFQTCSVTMQRWVMACPDIRELYHKQRCDGYSSTYQDLHPGKIGEDHYDYRRAVNGLAEFKEDGGYEAVIYSEELHDDDRELDFGEQLAIRHTWLAAQALLKFSGNKDLTSKEDESL